MDKNQLYGTMRDLGSYLLDMHWFADPHKLIDLYQRFNSEEVEGDFRNKMRGIEVKGIERKLRSIQMRHRDLHIRETTPYGRGFVHVSTPLNPPICDEIDLVLGTDER